MAVSDVAYNMAEMAPIGAGVYGLSGAASVLTGWVSDRWLAAGASETRIRKSAFIAGFTGVALGMSACARAGPLGSLLGLVVCGISIGINTTSCYATAQTLAGPEAAGRWMGVQNFFGNFAGIAAPVLTGAVVDRTGAFAIGFLIAAVLALVGMIAYGIMVRRIETIDWSAANTAGAGFWKVPG